MTDAPENIWAITEPDDVSADILGDVYAQQVPDGMNGTPIKYIREDVALAMVAAVIEECLDRIKDSDPTLSHTMRLETRGKADWQDAKAALDRRIAEAKEEGFWIGRQTGGSKAEIDMALTAIRNRSNPND